MSSSFEDAVVSFVALIGSWITDNTRSRVPESIRVSLIPSFARARRPYSQCHRLLILAVSPSCSIEIP